MLKYLLYAAIFFIGYRIFKYISTIELSSHFKSKDKDKTEQEPYSKYNIQDAEFKDIDEKKD